MKTSVEVTGVRELLAELQDLLKKMGHEAPDVTVGYGAPYAVHVHEDLQMRHPRGGQAKFLEQPAREMQDVIANDILAALRRGMSWPEAVLLGGLRLQYESQLLVPVDTGFLRASAYTQLVSGDE